MALRFVVFSALLAVCSAGIIVPITYAAPDGAVARNVHYANPAVDAIPSTHHNVVRTYSGTVSHHSKYVDTPYSTVQKEGSRISNHVYNPVVAEEHSCAPPAPTGAVYTHASAVLSKTMYADPPQTIYNHQHEAVPSIYTHRESAHSTPAVTNQVTYADSAVQAYHEVPSLASYNHGSAASIYIQNAPGVAHGSGQRVQYSPAEAVSHMSVDGFGTHWDY